jgi:hypothetical protein
MCLAETVRMKLIQAAGFVGGPVFKATLLP